MGVEMTDGPDGATVRNVRGWPGWTFTVKVTPGTPPTAGAVTVEAPKGQAITAQQWRRIPIGTITRAALDREENLMVRLVAAEVYSPDRRPYGGSPEHTKAMVSLYRTALQQGLSPRAVIAERFEVTEKTVSRWLADIRAQGALGTYAEEKSAAQRDPFPVTEASTRATRRVRKGRKTEQQGDDQ